MNLCTITTCRTCAGPLTEPSNGSPHTCRACERRLSGMRYVCAYCQTDLPGSNPQSGMVSHGACRPACEPMKALGW